MKVLIATPLGLGGKGGIDRMMDSLLDEIAHQDLNGLQAHRLVTRGSGSKLATAGVMVRSYVELTLKLMMGQCDLLHLNIASRGSSRRKARLAALAKRFGIPYVIHLHGAAYREYYESAPDDEKRSITNFFRGSAKILVLGNVWADFVVSKGFATEEQVMVFPNATHKRDHKTSNGSNAPVLLFLGEIGRRKGVPQLTQALGAIRHLSWTAIIAGKGQIEEAREELRQNGIEERVQFPGWVDSATADKLLSSSDVLILPSLAENLPMSVIEGMSAGLAVVTTPVGATSDIIKDGYSGLLVPPGEVAKLAEALTHVLEDRQFRENLGKNAQEYQREHLEIGGYAERMLQVWRGAALNVTGRVLHS